jgi:hypothetical protein
MIIADRGRPPSDGPTPGSFLRDLMLFDLQWLGKPDADGHTAVIESRPHVAESVEEAVRTAKEIIQNTPVPGTYGFRLIRHGLEVFHWFNEETNG